jgi:hypothetical protein
MKIVIVLSSMLFLAGCGAWERTKANYTGYSKLCVDGVTYIQFTSGATVHVDRTGKPVACRD